MNESIVCGIDDSAEAREAARVAGDLAQRLDARLILVNVPPPVMYVPPEGRTPRISQVDEQAHWDERRKRAEARLAAVARDAGIDGTAELRVSAGDVAGSLIEEAQGEGARLIVVGSRGQGAIRSAILGSVSAQLVREASCPVVVVPPKSDEQAGG